MSWSLVFDGLLCALLLALAVGAVFARALFTAVVFFIVMGLFVAIAWSRLGAVDLALAEAAIGAGLTGVLLVRAVARLRQRNPAVGGVRDGEAGIGFRLLVGGLCLLLFLALAQAALDLPPGPGVAPAVAANLPATGLGNPVTAVLLNFRGFDTLLETMVLVAALLAVWSLTADDCWPGRPGPADHARPGGVLASFARMLPPAGLLVGAHLFWAGADAPGGAFQAATVLAAVWLLAAQAGVAPPPPVSSTRLRLLVVAGPVLFLAIAALALPFGGFLVFPPAQAKAMVLALESALTVSLAAMLGLMVMGPPQGPAPAAVQNARGPAGD